MQFILESNKTYSIDEMEKLGIFFSRKKIDGGRAEYEKILENGYREGYHGKLKNGRFMVESRYIDHTPR